MIRRARTSDIPIIHRELNRLASEGMVLPRSLSELYTHMRDFFVWEEPVIKHPAGWCALHIMWEDLAEVRSLAVKGKYQRRGIGRRLVEACLDEARKLEIGRVFTLTYQVEFFTRLGFKIVDKHVLPQKIWVDCLNCTKFPDCDETAMLMLL